MSQRRALQLARDLAQSFTVDPHMTHHREKESSLMDALQHLAAGAEEQVRLRTDLHHRLMDSQETLAQFRQRHETILQASSHEMAAQYYAILGYANYLDERIAYYRDNPELRQDYDDVCESGFNLKLIAGALDILGQALPPKLESVHLPSVMQQTMLALAASLDRRAMKLNTAEVDLTVHATTDRVVIAHALWMMLLGLVRHAPAESTLLMECQRDEATQRATIGITVRALPPGASSVIADFCKTTPELFAGTIASHANIQLAELLLQPLDAGIAVMPFSDHVCRITLTLPA